MALAARTATRPASLAEPVRREAAAINRDAPVSSAAPMDQIVSNALWQPRFSAALLGAFALAALILAAAGIYGVVAFAVARRTQEIGVRMALGARPGDVLGMVVRQTLPSIGLGASAGIAGAASLGSTNYGQITSTRDSRKIVLGARLSF
jgi:putative ABC transport system permease protein